MSRMVSHRAAAFIRGAAGAIFALLALVPVAGSAGSNTAACEVEIVVFRHLDRHGNTPEVPPLPARSSAPAPTPAAAPGVAGLAPAALRLTGIAARLRRGPAYQLVYHGGWSQAVEAREQATPTALPVEALQAGLSGAITLYRERYLHALVDISLPAAGDAAADHWRIRQGRRLRGTALQYFDHPAFGVILAVRVPAEAAEASPAPAADEEP